MSIGTAPDRWSVRVWPGIAIVALIAFLMIVPAYAVPRSMFHFLSFVSAPVLGAVLTIVWWLGFSRVRGPIKWGVLAAFFIPVAVYKHLSIFKDVQPRNVITTYL